MEFIFKTIFWTLAFYGLFEITKNIIYIFTYTKLRSDGIYLIIAAKNQENKIEGFLRNFVFRLIYGKEEQVKNIIIADLNSNDDTNKILNKINKDYEFIKVTSWKECKDIIDNIDETK